MAVSNPSVAAVAGDQGTAHVKPAAQAFVGPGGVAISLPSAQAAVGLQGVAVSTPVAVSSAGQGGVAIAGGTSVASAGLDNSMHHIKVSMFSKRTHKQKPKYKDLENYLPNLFFSIEPVDHHQFIIFYQQLTITIVLVI